VLQIVCDVIKDTDKPDHLRAFVRIGLDSRRQQSKHTLILLPIGISSATNYCYPKDGRKTSLFRSSFWRLPPTFDVSGN